jgi:hypothetical protein
MGGEIGNLHASGGDGPALLSGLEGMPADWLRDAARRMAEAVEEDQAALAGALRKNS